MAATFHPVAEAVRALPPFPRPASALHSLISSPPSIAAPPSSSASSPSSSSSGHGRIRIVPIPFGPTGTASTATRLPVKDPPFTSARSSYYGTDPIPSGRCQGRFPRPGSSVASSATRSGVAFGCGAPMYPVRRGTACLPKAPGGRATNTFRYGSPATTSPTGSSSPATSPSGSAFPTGDPVANSSATSHRFHPRLSSSNEEEATSRPSWVPRLLDRMRYSLLLVEEQSRHLLHESQSEWRVHDSSLSIPPPLGTSGRRRRWQWLCPAGGYPKRKSLGKEGHRPGNDD
jgi:hypothetical protein